MSLEDFLPHKKPAVLISKIESMEDRACVVCMDPPGPEASPFLLIEAAAQAVAAMLGKSEHDKKRPPTEGYLVAVRKMRFLHDLDPARDVRVAITQARNLDPFFLYAARITQGDRDVARGTITLYKREV
ncbi:hypothetical protein K8S19_04450 [bacterium]|nr:hypothetical protein [bacterium]